MTKQELREAIRRIIRQELNEAAPAPSKPAPSTKPTVAPGKPGEKKDPKRRHIGNPNVQPGPKAEAKKATMKEAEMLKQVIKRFRSQK